MILLNVYTGNTEELHLKGGEGYISRELCWEKIANPKSHILCYSIYVPF